MLEICKFNEKSDADKSLYSSIAPLLCGICQIFQCDWTQRARYAGTRRGLLPNAVQFDTCASTLRNTNMPITAQSLRFRVILLPL